MSDKQDTLALWSQYGDLYNEIVRPERKYTISHYMRTRWAPLLGAARLWFVTALRQRCYWNKKQDWCIVDKKTLARESGLSPRTINRIVASADDGAEAADRDRWTSWFFDKVRRRRYHQQIGRTVNAPNRYHVLIDDPLTPSDQDLLARCLRHELAGNNPEDTLRALQRICDNTDLPLSECPSPAEEKAAPPVIPGASAFDVVQNCCPMPERDSALYAAIARASSQLHNAITQPEHVYMGNQYFRMKWLPDLGPTLALLIVDLRARCYWNERTGQVRDTCQATWAELAREIGCTTRQLRNLRQKEGLDQFVEVLQEGQGRALSHFRIHLFDPLSHEDQVQFEKRVRSTDGLEIDPETGQIDMYHAIQAERKEQDQPQNPEDLAPGSGGNPEKVTSRPHHKAEVLTPTGRKFWHVEGIKAEILASQPGKNGTTQKVRLITPTQKGLEETTLPLPEALLQAENRSNVEQLLAAPILKTLLTHFGILEPNQSKLIEYSPRCDIVMAWCLYTLTQPGLSENKAGYVYNRLHGGDIPPRDFIRLAGLSPPEWRDCHRAMRYHDMDLLSSDLETAVSPLSWVWDTLDIDLDRDPDPDSSAPEAPPLPGRQLPPKIAALLHTRDRVVQWDEGWILIVRDLYRAWVVTRAVSEWGLTSSIEVRVEGPSGKEYELNPEILALSVEALPANAWSSIRDELAMSMTRNVFALWWRDVLPLGICKGDHLVLGVPGELAGQWIDRRQLPAVERTCSGVLGYAVQVEFVTYALASPEPDMIPL